VLLARHANYKYYKVPATRTDWWLNKINTNIANDLKTVKALKKNGWRVVIVWECTLKQPKLAKTLTKILNRLGNYRVSL